MDKKKLIKASENISQSFISMQNLDAEEEVKKEVSKKKEQKKIDTPKSSKTKKEIITYRGYKNISDEIGAYAFAKKIDIADIYKDALIQYMNSNPLDQNEKENAENYKQLKQTLRKRG